MAKQAVGDQHALIAVTLTAENLGTPHCFGGPPDLIVVSGFVGCKPGRFSHLNSKKVAYDEVHST